MAPSLSSRHPPLPLIDLERMLLVTTIGGNTGWHYLIARDEHSAPHLSNYAGSAGGRTYPSAAGSETSELFFTDDTGTYFVATRDAPALAERDPDGQLDQEELLEAHHSRLRKISDRRLEMHDEEFRECVALQAQYVYDRFGKFPATVPSIYCLMYLQAHHLDLEFCDHYFQPGTYLRSHAEHLKKWH